MHSTWTTFPQKSQNEATPPPCAAHGLLMTNYTTSLSAIQIHQVGATDDAWRRSSSTASTRTSGHHRPTVLIGELSKYVLVSFNIMGSMTMSALDTSQTIQIQS